MGLDRDYSKLLDADPRVIEMRKRQAAAEAARDKAVADYQAAVQQCRDVIGKVRTSFELDHALENEMAEAKRIEQRIEALAAERSALTNTLAQMVRGE